ncbi:hypothetical protein [Kutzneria buriramensis]|uniref:Uncharacterized protein n=1 Tax=Kutzneria buriramensis TaxID=1045776 RepID=A0A3E0GVU4_9PSEU|nr:hypothetical protein [Kutzneria buriramensis]REH30999.1 hypothetical protein BCF44_12222 [Kutzneria buriramensis]
MPRNPVINRKNLHPMTVWKTPATSESIAQMRLTAAAMNVSIGSLVSTAFGELLKNSPEQIAHLMRQHGQLNDEELAAVLAVLAGAKPDQDKDKR